MIYRLAPIIGTFDDLRWGKSSVAEVVWVSAATPDEARDLVASKTLRAIAATGGSSSTLQSPWRVDSMTTCAPDTPGFDVPPGEVVRSGGLIVRPRT